jgi:hypothetical protein
MLKQSAMLEVKIGDRVYQFNLPSDAPLGEAHDAIFQMRSFIVDKINEALKLDTPKVPEVPEMPPAEPVDQVPPQG